MIRSQMLTAYGWTAVYEIDGSAVVKPLVGWLYEELSYPNWKIEGLVVDGDRVIEATSIDGFKTYENDLESASMDYLALKNGN
jgi:hypothetical protein